MIKTSTTIEEIKKQVCGLAGGEICVKLNMGRGKFITFPATLSGVYPSIFTVAPADKGFLGKTAYSYSEILCGRVSLSRAGEESQKNKA